jgi:hypothetical protein
MKIEEGERIVLNDNIEYLALKSCILNGYTYIILMTTQKPIEVKIVKELVKDNEIYLKEIEEKEIDIVLKELKK